MLGKISAMLPLTTMRRRRRSRVWLTEGAFQNATCNLVSFLGQQLISCNKSDDGHSSGLMAKTFERNGGLCTGSDYRDNSAGGSIGTCKLVCSAVSVNTRFTDVAPGNEDAFQSAVTKGPASVANEDAKDVFQLYEGDFFTSIS